VQDKWHETEQDQRRNNGKIGELYSREAAEQPEGDGRKLVIGIGKDLHQRDAGARERADDDARQHQHQGAVMAAQGRRNEIDQQHGRNAAEEGECLDAEDRQRHQYADHRAEPRPGRDPEDVGGHQRIAEQGLIGRASA
jgi:hypothetical protein